jgi:hypothetical protein
MRRKRQYLKDFTGKGWNEPALSLFKSYGRTQSTRTKVRTGQD